MTQPTTLIVSIDTEEDNWRPARTGITVENIRELPRLHRVLERLGVRPTYFVTYQVAIRPWAAEILREIQARGTGEIGGHLHAWNTPPLDEELAPGNTMALNLPQSLQAAKIATVTDALTTAFGERPRSFRMGRWALGPSTAAALLECGYRVDSSVTPFHSWARDDHGPSHVGAPLDVYRLDGRGDVRVPVPDGPLVEVPVTWGYSRGSVRHWTRLHALLDQPVVRRLKLPAIASRLGLVKHIGLNLELEPVENMLTLSRHLIAQGVRHLHVSWHSSSLCPALNPFVTTAADVERFYAGLEAYFEGLSTMVPLECATVREAAEKLAPRPQRIVAGRDSDAVRPRERRLMVISYHHPPDGAIGGMRWAGLTKYLGPLGWKSWIVTAAPPAAAADDHGATVSSCPRRRTLNDLYRALRLRGSPSGTASPSDDVRAAAWAGSGSVLAQLRLEAAMLLSLPDQGRGWVLRAAVHARRLIARYRPDAVVSTGPPHSAHLAAWLATRGVRTRWVADFRDPWAGPTADAWRGSAEYRSLLSRFLTAGLERLVVGTASGVICNTWEFAAAMRVRHPDTVVHWLPNGVDRDLLPHRDQCPFPGLAIAHVGTLYGGRDVGPILRAMRVFLRRGAGLAQDGCTLRIAGHIEGDQLRRLREQMAGLDLQDRVEVVGVLPRDAALQLAARSRLAVVLAQQQYLQVPAKLYELIGMGVPVVVIASPGSAAYSEAQRLGAMAVEPQDIEGLVRVMDDVWNNRVSAGPTARAAVDYRELVHQLSALLSGESVGLPVGTVQT